MSEKPSPKSAAERKRAQRQRQRQRMRDRGEPSPEDFARALRDEVFASYHSGVLTVDIPDLVRTVVERMAAGGDVSERGCRETVRALLSKAQEGGQGRAQV